MSSENYSIEDQNAVYFLTFTITDWVDVFTRSCYRMLVVDSLNYCIKSKGLTIYAWCLMSNHIHLVAKANDGFRLSDIRQRRLSKRLMKYQKVARNGYSTVFLLIVQNDIDFIFSSACDYAGTK